MEEGVGVGDAVSLVVHGSASAAAASLLKAVGRRPLLDQGGLIAGQGEFVHLRVGRVANADGETGERTLRRLAALSNDDDTTRP